VLNAQNTMLTTAAGFSRSVGRRSEIQLRYGLDESRQGSRLERRTFLVGGGLRRGLTRSLDLRLGHNVRWLRSEQESLTPSLISHDLDLGVDFHRALSFSRRSTVAFTSGLGAVTAEGTTQYIAIGSASLQHQLARTWSAAATFGRRMNVIEGIPQPVVGNDISAALDGGIGKRAGVLVRGSLMRGQVGLPAPDGTSSTSTISTFTTQARLLFTVWGGWQWYVEHYYYTHDAQNPEILSSGVPSSLARSGVRTGLDLNFPLLRKRR
jgi:hypothetical protein